MKSEIKFIEQETYLKTNLSKNVRNLYAKTLFIQENYLPRRNSKRNDWSYEEAEKKRKMRRGVGFGNLIDCCVGFANRLNNQTSSSAVQPHRTSRAIRRILNFQNQSCHRLVRYVIQKLYRTHLGIFSWIHSGITVSKMFSRRVSRELENLRQLQVEFAKRDPVLTGVEAERYRRTTGCDLTSLWRDRATFLRVTGLSLMPFNPYSLKFWQHPWVHSISTLHCSERVTFTTSIWDQILSDKVFEIS